VLQPRCGLVGLSGTVLFMNVTFRCPHCEQIGRVEFHAATTVLGCPACGIDWPIPEEGITDARIARCLVCPSTELFIRKDFSQKLGVAIVVLGILISSVFWYYRMPYWTYGVLFATALLDVVLYLVVGNVLHCYRCQAQYRGVPGLDDHEPFNLETHEKHRQQQIRLKQQVGSP
jgi:ribosomal protein S27E